MSEIEVKLIEVFQSYQGEGVDKGQAMVILRFKTCNKKCPWCDTSVKMRIAMETTYQLSDIQRIVTNTRSGLLITGGEPTVQRHFNDTLKLLKYIDYPIANVESNGFDLERLVIEGPQDKNIHYIYSPKIFNENDKVECIEKTKKLLRYKNVFIKVVYEEHSLMNEYLQILSDNITLHQSNKVWLMPEGVTRADLIRNSATVMDACEKYRFNFSSRDHVIYGYI